MSNDRYLRIDQVRNLWPVSRATVYNRIKQGRFPSPVKLAGDPLSYWRESEVRETLKL